MTTAVFKNIARRWLQEELDADNPMFTPVEETLDEDTDNSVEGDDDDGNDSLNTFIVVMSNLLLFFLIFGLSATVQVGNLKHQLTNKFAIFTGVAMQFFIMPVLGFVAVLMLQQSDFTEAMGVTLLVVTASPGGSYSNWWCSLFNAELALSVAMTSVSSILSILLLPLNLFVYTWLAYGVIDAGNEQEGDINVLQSLDFGGIFISLGVVLSAIVIGLYFGYVFDNDTFHQRANSFGSFCGISLILFSAFLGSGGGSDTETNFWSLPISFYIGVAFPCLVGITLANLISKSLHLSGPETVAISIECCYQNTAIATSVAVTMFDDPDERAEAISVPLFYGVVEALVIGVYCVIVWKLGWTKAPSDEKLCVVISRTYEIDQSKVDTDGAADPHSHDDANSIASSDDGRNSHIGGGSWLTRLFQSKGERHQQEAALAGASIPDKRSTPVPKQSKSSNTQRFRINSEDVTVSTTAASTPGTPATPYQPSPRIHEQFATPHQMETGTVPCPLSTHLHIQGGVKEEDGGDDEDASQRQLERTFDANVETVLSDSELRSIPKSNKSDSIELTSSRSNESQAMSVDLCGQPKPAGEKPRLM